MEHRGRITSAHDQHGLQQYRHRFPGAVGNTDGSFNTAIGRNAMSSTTLATFNTAIGQDSLLLVTIGGGNTSVGYGALSGTSTGSNSTALGYFAGWTVTDASNVICIGSLGQNVSNSTWIENIWNVSPQSANTAPVVVSDGGQLGIVASSERFKKDVANMDRASEMILSLRPVTFQLQERRERNPAVWFDCRRSGEGKPSPGAT